MGPPVLRIRILKKALPERKTMTNEKEVKAKGKKDYPIAMSFRFTPADMRKLAELASESKISKADVIRNRIRDTPLPTPLSKIDQKALQLLANIANNTNQIAKAINSQGHIGTDIHDALRQIAETHLCITDLLRAIGRKS